MEVIGFTTKYYTLWEVTEEVITTKYEKYVDVSHVYIKNISYDLETAKEKYPNAIVDTALHGHTSFHSHKCIEKYAVDEFKSGKYAGRKISECIDFSYLAWCYSTYNCIPYESRSIALKVLEDNGYKEINEYHLATPEEVAEIEKSFEECENNVKIIEETGSINFTFIKNLSEEGTIKIGNTELTWSPDKFKELEYGGYYYGLPLDSKGKAKRIKGKTLRIIPENYEIEISEYGWGATLKINVKDFKII